MAMENASVVMIHDDAGRDNHQDFPAQSGLGG